MRVSINVSMFGRGRVIEREIGTIQTKYINHDKWHLLCTNNCLHTVLKRFFTGMPLFHVPSMASLFSKSI